MVAKAIAFAIIQTLPNQNAAPNIKLIYEIDRKYTYSVRDEKDKTQ